MRRKLITLRRLTVSGFQNFVRNAWLSAAATIVMIVALTISMSAIILNLTAQNAITELSKDIKVSIYFQDNVDEAKRQELKNALSNNEYVVSVDFISKETAQNRLKAQQDEGFVDQTLALLGDDALPESFDVSVNNLDKLEDVAAIAREARFLQIVGQDEDDITLGKTRSKETIDRAVSAQRFITLSSIVAASIFAVVSVLIIFNTIRMAIFTRSDEIGIMKLIGATPDYIRGPFIIEAVLYGLIAGVVANIIIYVLVFTVGGKIADQREFAGAYELLTAPTTMATFMFGAVLAGVLIAIISSALAMEKYLRIKRW